jgi:hypothetical protein
MGENELTGVCIRQCIFRCHFIRESVKEGTVKIEFIRSCDNNSEFFMKNVNLEMYERHVKKFLGKEETDT